MKAYQGVRILHTPHDGKLNPVHTNFTLEVEKCDRKTHREGGCPEALNYLGTALVKAIEHLTSSDFDPDKCPFEISAESVSAAYEQLFRISNAANNVGYNGALNKYGVSEAQARAAVSILKSIHFQPDILTYEEDNIFFTVKMEGEINGDHRTFEIHLCGPVRAIVQDAFHCLN